MTVSSDMYDLLAAPGSIFISHIYTIRLNPCLPLKHVFFSFFLFFKKSNLH